MSILRTIVATATTVAVVELRQEIAHVTRAAIRAVKKTVDDRIDATRR